MSPYQARFHAVVSHTPGLVFACALQDDGSLAFPWLSDGCEALLGVTPARLQADPGLLLHLINEADRAAFCAAMQASRAAMAAWNWEGRIRVAAWHDEKWISLRASPRIDAARLVWDGIMTNITDSKTAQLEAECTRAALAELSRHGELVKEQERARIARELHDDLGGNLTAIKMALAVLARRLPSEPPVLAEKAAYLDVLVDRTIDAVHRISRDLRPSTLDLGLVAALEWQASEFAERTGVPCSATIEPGAEAAAASLGDDQATALFRMVQEALTNIAKHADATAVALRLARSGASLALSIRDNGRGVQPGDHHKRDAFGLRGMAERARALDASLALSPAPGGGTMVSILMPLPSRLPGAAP